MARDITTVNQTNLWGKQADSGLGLEPQRNDLYWVDFTQAVKNVATVSRIQLAPIIPQYVRSITLPEVRTKADPIRHDSIPFQMPSWDDPLDPFKLVFILDTKAEDDQSNVIKFLDAWLSVTRAGRGTRSDGYSPLANWLKLNSEFRVDFQFNVNIFLLRGNDATGFIDNSAKVDAENAERLRRAQTLANITYRNRRRRSGLMQSGQQIPASLAPGVQSPTAYGSLQGSVVEQNMVIHSTWQMKRAWLAAYKLSDLTYTDNALVTVDATFYADSFDLVDPEPAQFYGEAEALPVNPA